MKRIRDEDASDPNLAQARRLLESVEPLAASETRMRRVRAALDAPPKGGPGFLVGMGVRRLPALVLAALVGLFGASAFAAVRYVVTLVAESDASATQSTSTPAASQPSPGRRANDAHETTEGAQGLREARQSDALDDGAEPKVRTASDGAHARPEDAKDRSKARTHPRDRSSAREEGPPGSDSELVHRAVQALRRDGNPARAARLLAAHRRRNPTGPLAEEVLSLQIEAAAALGDGRAAAFAREYLKRHPRGRYASVAKKALGEDDSTR